MTQSTNFRISCLSPACLIIGGLVTQLCAWPVLSPSSMSLAQEPSMPSWRAEVIDQIKIGYGLQLCDVNGDGKTDILLADKSTIQWYENPTWTKHLIARDLTPRDNVCIAARDIDGDGKCEVAVGGQWNYRESVKDGAIFYLHPPNDRRQPWTPIQLPNEPSTHRMHWVKTNGKDHLVVKPLRGRGSVDGDGPGLKLIQYSPPSTSGETITDSDNWKQTVISDSLHLSHNFHTVNWDADEDEELVVAAKEGIWHFDWKDNRWNGRQLTAAFAGEVRDGKLPGGKRFLVAIEPMHGSVAAVYTQPKDEGKPTNTDDEPASSAITTESPWPRAANLSEQLKDGHALAVADFLGVGSDQIIVGWRAMNEPGVPGIQLFVPANEDGTSWHSQRISAEEVAVEDIKVGDLNGDGKVDIVAAARQTKNLVIFFNEGSYEAN